MSQASLYVGIDIGNAHHAICVVNDVGKVVLERMVRNDLTALEALQHCMNGIAADAVHIAVEDKNNALVDALLALQFKVSTINPKQVDRFRERSNVAGAKDDRRDARVLATTIRTDGELYRAVEVGDDKTAALRTLGAAIDNLDDESRRFSNQLRAHVLRCFPTLLHLCPGADKAWFWQLVCHVFQGGAVESDFVSKLLKAHRKRKLTVDEVLAIWTRGRLEPAPGVVAASAREVARLVEKLRLVDRQQKAAAAEREEILRSLRGSADSPSDIDVLRSAPGFGPKTTAAFATQALHLIKQDKGLAIVRGLSGIAPVTKRSGKSKLVQMRRACSAVLREALFHAAAAAARWDARFRLMYARLRAAGHNHARALRNIGDRLLHLVDAMLRHRTLYRDPPTAAVTP